MSDAATHPSPFYALIENGAQYELCFPCDEDGCGGEYPYYSDLTVTGLNPGEVYYICVMNPGDWGGSMAGPFVLKVEPY